MKKNDLVGYSETFVSFIFPQLKTPVKEIILFGSVARGDFDNESDIDIFLNVQNKRNKDALMKELKIIEPKFYKSKLYEIWKQKGVTHTISTKVGLLDEWDLKRSIISDGIILYGGYKSDVKADGYLLISFAPIKDITKRNRVMRKLFGRKEEKYMVKGLIEQFGGKKLAPTVFVVPMQFSEKIMGYLKKEKVDYTLYDIWSDVL